MIVAPAGILLPEELLYTDWFGVLATFVAINTCDPARDTAQKASVAVGPKVVVVGTTMFAEFQRSVVSHGLVQRLL